MCLGASAPKDNSGQIAADQEAKREANIKAGVAGVNRAFDGYDAGINPASTYTPGTKYYNADGSVYTPGDQSAEDISYAKQFNLTPEQTTAYSSAPDKKAYLIGAGKGTLTPQGQLAQRRNQQYGATYGMPAPAVPRNDQLYTLPTEGPLADWQNSEGSAAAAGGKLFTGTQHTGGYGQDFYDGITKNYEDYYNPQLDQQYQNALNSMTAQLGQQGILQSSEGNRQLALLKQSYDTNKQTVANNGLNAAATARQNVASQKNQLLAQANQAGDPSALAAQAAEAASSVVTNPNYSPLGSVFAGLLGQGTNALAVQQGAGINAGGGGTGAILPAFNQPLNGGGSGGNGAHGGVIS